MSTRNNKQCVHPIEAFRAELTADCPQSREKKQSKMEQSGLSQEELLRQQQELFRSATDKFNSGPTESM